MTKSLKQNAFLTRSFLPGSACVWAEIVRVTPLQVPVEAGGAAQLFAYRVPVVVFCGVLLTEISAVAGANAVPGGGAFFSLLRAAGGHVPMVAGRL